MRFVNRAAIILRPKSPFLEWAKIDDPEGLAEAVFQGMCDDPAVILVDDSEAVDAGVALVRKHWMALFEDMLEGWSRDESTWPSGRSLKMFRAWFDAQVATSTLDLGSRPIASVE